MSGVIAHEQGNNNSCHILLGFDTINLLAVSTFVLEGNMFVIQSYFINKLSGLYVIICLVQGILIFLVIVAKKPVLIGLKEKASSWRISQVNSSTSNTKVGQGLISCLQLQTLQETDLEMKSVTDDERQKQK